MQIESIKIKATKTHEKGIIRKQEVPVLVLESAPRITPPLYVTPMIVVPMECGALRSRLLSIAMIGGFSSVGIL